LEITQTGENMMKAIHKYRIGNERNVHAFNLKKGFKIVRSEYIVTEKSVFLWIEEPLAVDIETQQVTYRMAMSGDPVSDNCEHVATAIDTFGPEAYHIFEVGDQTKNESGITHPHIRAA
tara:strand:+ start:16945 stop:17301 length:357 start_codon:yes stop_codon:yes gene_type:complete